MRNYKRLALSDVPCPSVHLLREHVLLMGFIGRDGHAAPRLKDASLSDSQNVDASRQVGLLLRKIYQQCRLVHADFSEYNLLWYKGIVYVIDVSQSVEHDHPNALTFLRKDCENAIQDFRKRGVANVPHLQPLFDYVVDPNIEAADAEAAYDRLLAACEAGAGAGGADAETDSGDDDGGDGGGDGGGDAASRPAAAAAAARAEAQVAEAVFAQMHIPRTLEELAIRDAERDIATRAAGNGSSLVYTKVMGLPVAGAEEGGGAGAPAGVGAGGEGGGEGGKEEGGEEDGSSDDDDEDDGEDGEEEERVRWRRQLHRDEDKDEKKDRKAAVKAAQREARTTKTPKHVKKAKAKGLGGKKK